MSHIVRKPGARASAADKYKQKKPVVKKEVDPDEQPVRGVGVLQYKNFDQFYNVPEDFFTSQVRREPPENPLRSKDPLKLLKNSGLAMFPNLKEINEKNRNPPKYEIVDNGPIFENPEHELIYQSTDPKDVIIKPDDVNRDIKLAFFAPEKLKKPVIGINGYGTLTPIDFKDNAPPTNATGDLNSFANTKSSIANMNMGPPVSNANSNPDTPFANFKAEIPSSNGNSIPPSNTPVTFPNANPSVTPTFQNSSTFQNAQAFPSNNAGLVENPFANMKSTIPNGDSTNAFINSGSSKFSNPNDVKPASPSKRQNQDVNTKRTPQGSVLPNSAPFIPKEFDTTSFITGNPAYKDIFNKVKTGGMFDSILQDSNNTGEEYESNVKYRTKDEEEDNTGFNFFN